MDQQSTLNRKDQLIPLSYKIVTLAAIMGNWILCFSMMFLNFQLYKQITLCALIYLFYWGMMYDGKLIYAARKTLKIIEEEKKRQSTKLQKSQQPNNTHIFVVPNYKQDLTVLRRTLQGLSSHQFSQNYLIILAMEQSQKQGIDKATQLTNQFANSFKGVQFSLHTASAGQAQGKAANVNWCTMRLQAHFEKYQLNSDKVLVTVIDADSIIPQIYIAQLQRKCQKDSLNIHDHLFCSPHIYSINRKESMILGRAFDTLYSFLHYVTMHSFSKISFPISNYTISYKTLKQINFNDVHKDCIAQDCHLTLKAISETNGRLSVIPIYTFSNQMNLCGEKSFFEECKSKFWQEERHQRGVLQISYAFKNVVNSKFKNKNIIMSFLSVLHVYLDQIAALWFTSFLICQFILQNILNSYIDPSGINQIIQLLSFILSLKVCICMLIWFYARLNFEMYFFKIFNFKEKIMELVETLILFPVASIIYAQTAGIVAVIELFNENSRYITTQKKIAKQ